MNKLDNTYQHILETMNDGVMALSEQGEFLLFNTAASQILGLATEDVMGKPLVEVFYTGDDANDEFTQAVLNAVYTPGKSTRVSAPYTRADGKKVFLEISSSYLEQPGERAFSGVVVVFKDITMLRELYEEEKDLSNRLTTAYRDLEEANAAMRDKIQSKGLSRALLILLVLLVCGAAAAYVYLRDAPKQEVIAEAPQVTAPGGEAAVLVLAPQELSLQISLSGYFDPLEIVNLVSPFTGRILKKHTAFGREVKKGAPLLELDTSELQVKLRDAETKFIKARQEYERVKAWEKSDEVSNARRAFVKTKRNLDSTRNKMLESKDLYHKGIIPQDEYEALRIQYENEELDYFTAQEKLDSVLAKGAEDNIRIASMALENARFEYENLQRKITTAIVRAPVDGLVIAPKSGHDEPRSIEVGGSFNEGDILLAVGNMEGFTVSAKADEVDMIKLKQGQPVRISGDAFPGMALSGRISSISAQAARSQMGEGGAVFDVVVEVDPLTQEQRARIRLGMMAIMEVTVYANSQALLAPIAAVHQDADGRYVTLKTPTGVERRNVRVGMTTLNAVEITSGLAPGDAILTGGP